MAGTGGRPSGGGIAEYCGELGDANSAGAGSSEEVEPEFLAGCFYGGRKCRYGFVVEK